jgi:hypothetical protein
VPTLHQGPETVTREGMADELSPPRPVIGLFTITL